MSDKGNGFTNESRAELVSQLRVAQQKFLDSYDATDRAIQSASTINTKSTDEQYLRDIRKITIEVMTGFKKGLTETRLAVERTIEIIERLPTVRCPE